MIIQPHRSIFIGPVTSGESAAHQITINMSLGIKPDDVILDAIDGDATKSALRNMKWTVNFMNSRNYTPEASDIAAYPELTSVSYSAEDANSFTPFYNDTSYVYIGEFDADNGNVPKYYDIACNFSSVPTEKLGKLQLPIIEAYGSTTDPAVQYKDALEFELIYNFDTVKTVTPLSSVVGNSTPFTEVEVIPSNDMFDGNGKLFYYTTTYLNTAGSYASVNSITCPNLDGLKYIEPVQRNIQSQWFTGFLLRQSPHYDTANFGTQLNEAKYQLLICNPHSQADDGMEYDYALVFYTAPYAVAASDNDQSSVYVLDPYEGIMSVGNVNYYDDKYYVVPLKPGQVLASADGMMISNIKFIQTKV